MRVLRLTGVTLVLFSTACQTYQSASMTELVPGSIVRVTFNDNGRQRMASSIGPNVEFVTGTVTSRDSGAVTLQVSGIRRKEGLDEVYQNQTPVTISRNAVQDFGLRRLSVVRSALLAGAIAGGAIVIGSSIGGQEANHQRGAGGEPNPQ